MDANKDLFAPDFKQQPYWWEAAPRPQLPSRDLPSQVDVAVIGSGFTGLSAALTLARAGRGVVVLEAQEPGYGASSRNAGFVGRTLKHSFGSLLKRYGPSTAIGFYQEMRGAFDYVTDLIQTEQIECQFVRCGRFMGALSPAQYEAMGRELELRKAHLGDASEMVPRSQQHTEIGSDLYYGGALMPDLGGLHPGRYHLGLLERVRNAGVEVHAHTRVTNLLSAADGHTIETTRGSLLGKEVFVATNGYTQRATPWFQRRLIPFRGFMIATEPLDDALLKRILPKGRTFHDYNNNLNFMRRTPDGKRILFGGLTGSNDDNLERMATRLHAVLTGIVPDLKPARLSHAWSGNCAGTFDMYPHIGLHEGVHYALGYCFAGVPMGTYLGHKAALRILGRRGAATVFDSLPFTTRSWYRGNPWFLPAYMAYCNWLDRRSAKH